MKKFWRGLLAVSVLTVGLFTGCGGNQAKNTDANKPADKIRVVTTVFPLYDWTRVLIGENSERFEVTFLLGNGVDMHSYQPTSADFLKISDADLCVFVGGESDEWLEDALENAKNDKMIKLNLMKVLGDKVKFEEHIEGMETDEHDHEDDDKHKHHNEISRSHGEHNEHDVHAAHEDHNGSSPHPQGAEPHKHDLEKDEHIWLSLKNAPLLCAAISDALGKVDANHKEAYQKNLTVYQKELATLDDKYRQTIEAAPLKTLIFADRFPFRYLTDDYGLKYYAAFPGCSAETEASFKTIAFLTDKARKLKPKAILTVEGRSHQIAESVAQNAAEPGMKILTLDSMQATTAKDAQSGVTYLGVMSENLNILKEALSK